MIRRIKMLELALKQERVKYYKLKYGIEPKTQEDLKTQQQQTAPDDQQDNSNLYDLNYSNILNSNSQLSNIKNGRQLLRQYLQEIGYADTIIDIRSSRLRTLFSTNHVNKLSASKIPMNDEHNKLNKTHLVNGSDSSLNTSAESVRKLLLASNSANNADMQTLYQHKQQMVINEPVQMSFNLFDGMKSLYALSRIWQRASACRGRRAFCFTVP
jgi:hypothetical protein